MYTIKNNLASTYLNEMFLMRDANLGNTSSNLRSVANKTFVIPQVKCNFFKVCISYLCLSVCLFNCILFFPTGPYAIVFAVIKFTCINVSLYYVVLYLL